MYVVVLKYGMVYLILIGFVNGVVFKVNNIFKVREIVKSVFKIER